MPLKPAVKSGIIVERVSVKEHSKKNTELAELRQRRIVELEKKTSMQKRIGALNARLAAIVESCDDAIIGKDLDGTITSWNRGAEKIYGYTAAEAVGRSIELIVPPEDKDEVPRILERIRRGEKVGHFETVRLRKDGSPINMSVTISPIEDGAGNIVGASTIARDISGRKEREEIIWRQSQTLNQILDAVITTDLNGVVIDWNKGSERMFSYSREEALGRHVSFIYPEDRREFLDREIIKPLRKEGEFKTEARLRQKTGEEFNALLFLTLLRDENGAAIGMIGSSVDITERIEAEGKIRLAKDEWEQTFDAIPDMVAVIDRQYIIRKVNRAMAEKLGIDRKDLVGSLCYRVMHGAERPTSYCPHHKAITDEKEYVVEAFDENANRHYLISVTPIREPGGNIAGIVQVSRDVSEQKKMEEKLQEAAVTDVLTGLFNRRGFFKLAEQQLNLAERKNRSMLLLYLDMNNMKEINDRCGHKEGDRALIDTANLLRKTFRESDIVARMGGDEFAVLLTEPPGPDIIPVICDHIRLNLRDHNNLGGREYRLSLSLGAAYYDPLLPCSIVDLLSIADMRMYKGKKQYQNDRSVELSVDHDRRQYDRSADEEKCWAEIGGLGRARIINISSGGICVETEAEIGIRRRCEILVHSPLRDVRHEGVVIWSRRAESDRKDLCDGFHYESGIQFLSPGSGRNQAPDRP